MQTREQRRLGRVLEQGFGRRSDRHSSSCRRVLAADQQCEDAPCVHVCPTGASYRDPDTGVVLVNKELCIGCKYCMMACPYGVRSWNAAEKCVEKCTLCGQLTSQGELPACVKACCGEARFYGDLDDPESDASKLLASYDEADIHHLTDVGNRPVSAYVLSPRFAEWKSGD